MIKLSELTMCLSPGSLHFDLAMPIASNWHLFRLVGAAVLMGQGP